MVFVTQDATSGEPSPFSTTERSETPPVSRMVKRMRILPLSDGLRLSAFS